MPEIAFSVIPFSEWRVGIAPLWHQQGRETHIHRTLQGHGQLRYTGRQPYEKILLFPIVASRAGNRVGWTSIYNISEAALRIRGIYVLEGDRGLGIGRGLAQYAMSLWPARFGRCFMYARTSNIPRYLRWGFELSPGYCERSFEMAHLGDDKQVALMHRDRG